MNLGTMKLHCPQCGGDQFQYPDDPNLDSQVTCRQCGAVAAVRDIADKDEALRIAKQRITEAMRKPSKRKP